MHYKIVVYKHCEINPDLWDKMIINSGEALPFSYYNYFNIFNPDDIYYIIAEHPLNGKYFGGIGCRLIGKIPVVGNLFSVILLESSVLIDKNQVRSKDIIHIKEEIYSNLILFSKEIGAIQIILNHWSRETSPAILKQNEFVVQENHTIEIDLNKEIEVIFKEYSSSCRGKIRKSINKGVVINTYEGVESLSILETISNLSNLTYIRAKKKNKNSSIKKKSLLFYENLFRSLEPDALLVTASTPEGECISFAIILKIEDLIINYRGGSSLLLNREYAASNLLFHRIIELNYEKNIIFDMGGVPVNPDEKEPAYGVYRFKKSFGGDLKVYYSGYKVIKPILYSTFKLLSSNRFLEDIYKKLRPLS